MVNLKQNSISILILFIFASLSVCGCQRMNYAEHMKDQKKLTTGKYPVVKIDYDASAMVLLYDSKGCDSDGQSLFNREEILNALEKYVNQELKSKDQVDARVIVETSIEDNYLYLLQLLIPPTPGWVFLFGSPVAEAEAQIKVSIEVEGKVYQGSGKGRCFAGVYYPGDQAQCAFSKALVSAIQNAVQQK